MLKDFKAFILRGNVIDLAIGVAIGAAFTAVVASFTENLLTPLLAIPGDAASLAELDIVIGGSRFRYGAVIDSTFAFVITAAVLFLFVVRPLNALVARRAGTDEADATRECPECLSTIPSAARRCARCASEVAPA